jgi:hypothetical protein
MTRKTSGPDHHGGDGPLGDDVGLGKLGTTQNREQQARSQRRSADRVVFGLDDSPPQCVTVDALTNIVGDAIADRGSLRELAVRIHARGADEVYYLLLAVTQGFDLDETIEDLWNSTEPSAPSAARRP